MIRHFKVTHLETFFFGKKKKVRPLKCLTFPLDVAVVVFSRRSTEFEGFPSMFFTSLFSSVMLRLKGKIWFWIFSKKCSRSSFEKLCRNLLKFRKTEHAYLSAKRKWILLSNSRKICFQKAGTGKYKTLRTEIWKQKLKLFWYSDFWIFDSAYLKQHNKGFEWCIQYLYYIVKSNIFLCKYHSLIIYEITARFFY